MSQVSVAFVIPAFNEERFLPQTLESIHKLVAGRFPYEIIVVDNGSSDQTVALARAQGASTHIVPNVTVGALRNHGARHSSADVLVFLDADVVLTEAWAAHVTTTLDQLAQNPAMVTGSACGVPADASWLERNWFGPWRTGRSSHINSGHMVIARSLFDQLGGFDETLQTGEDYEFSLRAQTAGAKLASNPELAVIHNGYPKTLSAFMRREVWHGRSDFVSVQTILRSGIALIACLFLALHVVFGVALVTGSWAAALSAFAAIMLICTAMSVRQYRTESVSVMTANAVIYYFYFLARVMALFKAQFGSTSFVHRESR